MEFEVQDNSNHIFINFKACLAETKSIYVLVIKFKII